LSAIFAAIDSRCCRLIDFAATDDGQLSRLLMPIDYPRHFCRLLRCCRCCLRAIRRRYAFGGAQTWRGGKRASVYALFIRASAGAAAYATSARRRCRYGVMRAHAREGAARRWRRVMMSLCCAGVRLTTLLPQQRRAAFADACRFRRHAIFDYLLLPAFD
jgi:hypothetical protein